MRLIRGTAKQQPTRGLALVWGDKTRISTFGTLLNFGSSSTERNRTVGIKTQLYIIIQRATAKRDTTQCPTIAKPCSLPAMLLQTLTLKN
jgi:hypothetical protein